MRRLLIIFFVYKLFSSSFINEIDKVKFTDYLWKGLKITRTLSNTVVKEVKKEFLNKEE